MRETLGIEPVFAAAEILLIAALAVGYTIWLFRRATGGDSTRRNALIALLAVRVTAIAAISALLLNPVWTRSEVETTRPPLLLLFDSSHSMAVHDVNGEDRFTAAKTATV